MGFKQYRGWVDQRHLLRRLRGRRRHSHRAYRPRGSETGLSCFNGNQRSLGSGVRYRSVRCLVSKFLAAHAGYRLGRHVYAGAEGVDRCPPQSPSKPSGRVLHCKFRNWRQPFDLPLRHTRCSYRMAVGVWSVRVRTTHRLCTRSHSSESEAAAGRQADDAAA